MRIYQLYRVSEMKKVNNIIFRNMVGSPEEEKIYEDVSPVKTGMFLHSMHFNSY